MIDRMRTLASVAMVACSATMFVSVDAYASSHDPHHEEQDGCDHGATGKECREDPSEKGKDCEQHGKHGGINEDHCATTTTGPGVTVPTVPEVTVPTVPGTTDPTVSDTTETTTEPEAPLTAPPGDDTLAVTGSPSESFAGLGVAMLLFGAGLRKLVRRPVRVR